MNSGTVTSITHKAASISITVQIFIILKYSEFTGTTFAYYKPNFSLRFIHIIFSVAIIPVILQLMNIVFMNVRKELDPESVFIFVVCYG